MHLSPLEALFDRLFHGVLDLVFLGLFVAAYRILRGTRWQFHLAWIVPYLYENALQVIYRAIWNSHFVLGIFLPNGIYVFARLCLYVSDVVGLYGTVILVRTLRQMVQGTLPTDTPGHALPVTDETVWPPPPRRPG